MSAKSLRELVLNTVWGAMLYIHVQSLLLYECPAFQQLRIVFIFIFISFFFFFS